MEFDAADPSFTSLDYSVDLILVWLREYESYWERRNRRKPKLRKTSENFRTLPVPQDTLAQGIRRDRLAALLTFLGDMDLDTDEGVALFIDDWSKLQEELDRYQQLSPSVLAETYQQVNRAIVPRLPELRAAATYDRDLAVIIAQIETFHHVVQALNPRRTSSGAEPVPPNLQDDLPRAEAKSRRQRFLR